jgi:hypothetical protein
MSTPEDRQVALAVLTELHAWYREQGYERSGDVVADVVDILTGWSGPHAMPPSWQAQAADPRLRMCGIVCTCGPNLEPLACAYNDEHDGEHSWATLPTFPAQA